MFLWYMCAVYVIVCGICVLFVWYFGGVYVLFVWYFGGVYVLFVWYFGGMCASWNEPNFCGISKKYLKNLET